MTAVVLGIWNEPLVLGPWEWAMVGLTHAIILGIALVRYGWFERRRPPTP